MKKLKQKLHIDMETVSLDTVRQRQVDDWFDPVKKGKNLLFTIQTIDLGNTDMEFLVLIHALVESYLCFRRGITDKKVSEFDAKHLDVEPGDMPEAPYYNEHKAASKIEEMLSKELEVDWIEYDGVIEKTLEKWKGKSK